jgi:signal transduction histidine kinase
MDLAWALLWLLGLAGILIFARWEVVPFHLIWVSFALLYGFRIRSAGPTLWILAAMVATTLAAVGVDVARGSQPPQELTEVPLMAAMVWAMAWHAHRRVAADTERHRVSEQNAALLATQRRFLQDASHQLRTPITIALGHAELLARDLADRPGKRDIRVVVGELNRLRSLGERLLLIAASENPDFLRPEPMALDELAMEVLRRWQPAATRSWRLGHLDHAVVNADRERVALAIDALLENAVQHTSAEDVIRLSVACGDRGAFARLTVEDTGSGIVPGELAHIFDRFATGSAQEGPRGTGLGLALVLAIARGHGGEVRVHSAPGDGSRFEFLLPLLTAAGSQVDGPLTTLAGSAPGGPGNRGGTGRSR